MPRSVSLLPIAKGCQARCAFCFSRASISADQKGGDLDPTVAARALREGRSRGAEGAVITGGGDPGLVPLPRLLQLVRACAEAFPRKVVLITNGLFLAALDEGARRDAPAALEQAGLTVLSLSRHHPEPAANARIMGLDTRTEEVLESVAAANRRVPRLTPGSVRAWWRSAFRPPRESRGACRRASRPRSHATGSSRV